MYKVVLKLWTITPHSERKPIATDNVVEAMFDSFIRAWWYVFWNGQTHWYLDRDGKHEHTRVRRIENVRNYR